MLLKAYFFQLKCKMFRYTLFLCLFGCGNSIGTQQPPKDNLAKPATIQTIIYKSYGGEMGYGMALYITKDSLQYFYSLAASNKRAHANIGNTKAFWDSLTVNFDVANFKQIKDGNSNQPVDGTDNEINIITNDLDTITVINPYQDSMHYQAIAAFEQLLLKKVNALFLISQP
jgi:hypothetical protein